MGLRLPVNAKAEAGVGRFASVLCNCLMAFSRLANLPALRFLHAPSVETEAVEKKLLQ